MRFLAAGLALLACLLSGPQAVQAKSWVIDYAHSQLGFKGQQGDSPFTSFFKNFTATVDFDPDKPETGKIAATIDIASSTAGSRQRDDWLPQADWFDIKRFPQATFASTAIRKTSDGYAAEGNLTLKGITRPLTLNFTLTPEGDHLRAKGSANLTRTDFKIGEGDWANENYVKLPVTVTIDLAAKPAQ